MRHVVTIMVHKFAHEENRKIIFITATDLYKFCEPFQRRNRKLPFIIAGGCTAVLQLEISEYGP